MNLDIVLTLAIILAVLIALILSRIAPYLILSGAMVLLMVLNILSPEQALKGFSSPGVIVIGSLGIIAASMQRTGFINYFVSSVWGVPKTLMSALLYFGIPIISVSAFINNTTVVTLLTPAVKDWSKRIGMPASKFFIPLSYFAIVGGMCTTIGSSTNLLLNSVLVENSYKPFDLFELGKIGLPIALITLVYISIFAKKLLPSFDNQVGFWSNDLRQFTFEMIVDSDGLLHRKTIQDAGLRNLPGTYLMEIHRNGKILRAVAPEELLEDGDQLIFVGQIEYLTELQKVRGLRPATNQVFKLQGNLLNRIFVEAVVAKNSILIGKTIKENNFRKKFNAVILGVSRSGEKIDERIGDIRLEAGDSLFIETSKEFIEDHNRGINFYLATQLKNEPFNKDKAGIIAAIFVIMILAVMFDFLQMVQAAPLAALLSVIFKCINEDHAMRSLDVNLLIGIASSLALGEALTSSGAANFIATSLNQWTSEPLTSLVIIYLTTIIVTELITNNAALIIMLPIAIGVANKLGVSVAPFAMSTWIAASSCLMLPMGYQTNLIVYGAGGYKLRDFIKFGFPLSLLIFITSIYFIPKIWHF